MTHVLAFAWLLLTGFGILCWALPTARWTEKLGLAFPLSAGLHAAAYFALMQCWRASVLWSALLFAPFIFFIVRPHLQRGKSWRLWDAVPAVFITVSVLRVTVHLAITPAMEWDSVAMWIFKGKAIALDGALTSNFASWLRLEGLHPEYPWNVPMMHAWLARAAGGFSEPASKWVYVVYFSSLLLILYSLARLRWRRTGALAFVSAYLAIPVIYVLTFYRDADMMLETLIASALFLVVRYQKDPTGKTIILLGAAVFLCCWTKIEGVVFTGLLLLPYLGMPLVGSRGARKMEVFWGAAVAWLLGFLAFWIPKEMLGAETFFAAGVVPLAGLRESLARAGVVLENLLIEMTDVPRWNLTWFLPLAILWMGRDPYRMKFLFLGHVALYFIVYFLTPVNLTWHMQSSLSRVLLHTLPALFVWGVFAFPQKTETARC